jgi:hypothetical protein
MERRQRSLRVHGETLLFNVQEWRDALTAIRTLGVPDPVTLDQRMGWASMHG